MAARETIDLASLSVPELLDLIEKAHAAVAAKKRETKELVLAGLAEQAKAAGFSLEELFGAGEKPATPKRNRRTDADAPGEAKYRNPDNPAQTWTGRGRKPGWVKEREDRGETLEGLRGVSVGS